MSLDTSIVGEGLRRIAKGLFVVGDVFGGQWPGPKVLIYHQVTARPQRQLDVDPVAFSDHIDWLTSQGEVVTLDSLLAGPDVEDRRHDFVLTFDDGFNGLYDHAYPLLRQRRIPFTLYITSNLVETASQGDQGEMLTWDQVNEMVSSGLMTVGAHTHTHPDLRDLDHSSVLEEVEVSDRLIEERTGVRPRHFAYPKGYWSAIAEPVIRARYDSAVLGAGPPITGGSDFHRLSRIPVQRADGTWFFRWKVKRGLRLEEAVRSRIKGYSNPTSVPRDP